MIRSNSVNKRFAVRKGVASSAQPLLFPSMDAVERHISSDSLIQELLEFRDFRQQTRVGKIVIDDGEEIPVFTNEFWTSKQRAARSLHEISYRACFKPQLPRFFIERLTEPESLVYDPFLGRGTTMIESALLGRRVAGCDI